MTYAPNFFLPLNITSWGDYGVGQRLCKWAANPTIASAAWPTANLIIYVPIFIPWPYPVARVFWHNGTAAGSNWAMGIYSDQATAIYRTPSTAGATNSVPQYVTVGAGTPLTLQPGGYLLALVCDATTANRALGTSSYVARYEKSAGMVQEAGSTTLPATATPATMSASWLPYCGITQLASGM